jgi:hypothetical protein
MEVKTKLSAGDIGYFVHDNCIKQMLITKVIISGLQDNCVVIEYKGKITDSFDGNVLIMDTVLEDRIFPTLEGLLKYLSENVHEYDINAKPELA